jgi:hypothetical protein
MMFSVMLTKNFWSLKKNVDVDLMNEIDTFRWMLM